jgi:hypothetical protein
VAQGLEKVDNRYSSWSISHKNDVEMVEYSDNNDTIVCLRSHMIHNLGTYRKAWSRKSLEENSFYGNWFVWIQRHRTIPSQ